MSKQHGMTLLELMVVIAIVGIIAAFAVPSFGSLIANQKLSTMRDGLVSAVQMARGESFSRNKPVAVCPSSNGTSCLSSNNWKDGFLVFQDDSTAGWDGTETVLRYWEAAARVGSKATATATFIRFRPQGVASHGSDQTITFCDPKSTVQSKTLVIAPTTGLTRGGPLTVAGCS